MQPFRAVVVLALAAGLAAPAVARATYLLAVRGQVDHTVDCWEEVPVCSGAPDPAHVYRPWTGTLTIVVDGAGDGTYTGADFESLSFAASVGSFAITPAAVDPAMAVTIAGSQVSSLDAFVFVTTPHDTTAWDFFHGLQVDYDGSGGTHYGSTVAAGALSAVPEPAPAWLLPGALAVLALARRRASAGPQACASGQRGFTSNA